MRWWNSLALGEAALEVVLASGNAFYFWDYASRVRPQARRVGAASLAFLNLSLSLEATAFLVTSLWEDSLDLLSDYGVIFFLRSLLLTATAVISLLIWRADRR